MNRIDARSKTARELLEKAKRRDGRCEAFGDAFRRVKDAEKFVEKAIWA